ncbi:MAG: hypothetical protein IPN20_15015 [Haliscomenobacter sp.]|nr:hypothetical protein [Haliscomenobacter sp.]
MTVPHRTDFFHILLLKGGILKHIVDFQIFEIQPVVLLFINSDAVHAFENVEQVEGKALSLDSFFVVANRMRSFCGNNCACFQAIFAPSQD